MHERDGAAATTVADLLLSIVVPLLVIPLLLWGNPRFHLPLVPFMVLAAAALVTGAVARAHRAAGRRD
jgi:hypothetical protein